MLGAEQEKFQGVSVVREQDVTDLLELSLVLHETLDLRIMHVCLEAPTILYLQVLIPILEHSSFLGQTCDFSSFS